MKPRYMIHTIPEREWYVREYLIPQLTTQGIPRRRIKIWCDRHHDGNLLSCMSSFLWCAEQAKARKDRDAVPVTWHLQDDVVPKKRLAIYTERLTDYFSDYPVICGFCADRVYGEDRSSYTGAVPPEHMWWSFQCIRIDDDLAGECAEWFFRHEDLFYKDLDNLIAEGKGDDSVFEEFMRTVHPYATVHNLSPNLVQHVDDLLGGSVVNKGRLFPIRAKYWNDNGEMDELRRWLERRTHEKEKN